MVRRSTPQKKIDDRSFPVRLRFIDSRLGHGPSYMTILSWLQDNVGSRNFAWHGDRGSGTTSHSLLYFRTVEAAASFTEAFPDYVLADNTREDWYSSPAKAAGLD